MKNSAAAKVAAGDDVTCWRPSVWLANVRGGANVSAGKYACASLRRGAGALPLGEGKKSTGER